MLDAKLTVFIVGRINIYYMNHW